MNKFLFTSILLFGIAINFTYVQKFEKLSKEQQAIVKQVNSVLHMKQNFNVYPDSIAFYPYLIKLKRN